jgi:hypothetical protein
MGKAYREARVIGQIGRKSTLFLPISSIARACLYEIIFISNIGFIL